MLKNSLPGEPFVIAMTSFDGNAALSTVYDCHLLPSNFSKPAPEVPHHTASSSAIISELMGFEVPVFKIVKSSF